jgi:hypothetical protein
MALPTGERARVVVGKFDPARVFPQDDRLTVPLLRLMLAADDVRHASVLFIMADHQVNRTEGVQQDLHLGQMWYLFRLLCSHLSEAGNGLKTLLKSVPERRLAKLLKGRPDAVAALGRLRTGFGKDAFVTKVRDSIGSHYQQADVERVFRRELEAARVQGALVACEVGALSRFTMTDVLALRLMDEAAGTNLAAGGRAFEDRGDEVTALARDLTAFVDHLVNALLKERGGVDFTEDTVEVPALLRAARDRLEEARERPTA